jgi:hypothetical protein
MSARAQPQSQKREQQLFCSRDTEKTYVEGLEDGYHDEYRDDLQDRWSRGFDKSYGKA